LVIRLVKRRTQEVAHGGIGNHETLVIIALQVKNAGDERSGRSDNRPTRLEQKIDLQASERLGESVSVTASTVGEGQRVRVYVGIDAQRDIRAFLEYGRDSGQPYEFRLALHVKQQDVGFQRQLHLGCGFADARKYDWLGCLPAHRQYSFQFAAGDHVEPAA